MFSVIEVWFGRGGCVIRGLVAGSPVATCCSPNYSLIRPRVCLNNIIRIQIFFAIVVSLFQSGLARKPELSEWENRAASSPSNREFVYRFCACLVCLMVYGEWNTKKLKLYIFSKKKAKQENYAHSRSKRWAQSTRFVRWSRIDFEFLGRLCERPRPLCLKNDYVKDCKRSKQKKWKHKRRRHEGEKETKARKKRL